MRDTALYIENNALYYPVYYTAQINTMYSFVYYTAQNMTRVKINSVWHLYYVWFYNFVYHF